MLEASWQRILGPEFEKPYMQNLRKFLREEKDHKKIIYPKSENVFNAFKFTPFEAVKVVILGQDPYHGPAQAHGLCFSVPKGIKPPPSLMNIFKELESDLKIPSASHGCLEYWAEQGVLLLNSVLTVQQGMAGSHQGKGWEQFTDEAIAALNEQRESIAFVLWGAYAQRKGQFIDMKKHAIFKAPHPSPLSAFQGFLGCRHFSKINDYLLSQGVTPIDWQLEK
jgi:uracil-DNA glycosylase